MSTIVIIGGFGVGKIAYAAEIAELEKTGKKVLFFNPKGTIREKVISVYTEIKNQSLGKIDLVGFSEGSLVAALLALARNLEVQRLVLVNPAGLIGEDSVARLVCRFIRQIVEEGAYVFKKAFHLNFAPLRVSARVGLEFLKNCLCNRYIWQELSEITQTDIVSLLRDLKKGGVEIILVSAHSDRVFPKERIAKKLEDEPLLVEWLSFKWKDASHNVSYLKETIVLRQILGW